MKKILSVFIVLCLIGWTYFYIEYRKSEAVLEPHEVDKKFVSIKDNRFYVDGQPFYPKVINFVISLRVNDTAMWPAIYVGYGPNGLFPYDDKISSLKDLQAHLNLVKELGYNTVRLVGIGEPEVRDRTTGRINFKASFGNNHNYCLYLNNDNDYTKYLNALDDLMKEVENAGLKAILTTRLFKESHDTEINLEKITSHFKDNTSLLAYDFFNEPLYFDSLERKKEDVYYITLKWQKIAKKNDPNHLTTIGLANQRELFEWDPNLMNVDFISFHPYEFEKDQVRNEMYWYNRFVKKPWIIGETGIPADNDSVPYSDQVAFANKTMLQNYNCGGMGYSWWQFKDVDWKIYHQNFLGVLSWTGETKTRKGEIVNGTPKPVNKAINDFDVKQKKGKCECLSNYYNFNNHNKFRVTGKMVNEDGEPIEGGEILAWDEWWVNHHVTTTKPDGTFELYSEYSFYHWMVAGPLYDRIRGDYKPDTASIGSDGIPTLKMGTITLKKLNVSAVQ